MNSTRIFLLAIAAALAVAPATRADTNLPASGVYSAASDTGFNFFSETPFVPTVSVSQIPGQTAAIALNDYSAQAKTTLGSNHAFAQASSLPSGSLSVGSFSGWYDQVTITGGTGTGTAQFTVQLNGIVNVGAIGGNANFFLVASNIHPSLLTSTTIIDPISPTAPWFLAANEATPIADYRIAASPYIDTVGPLPIMPTPPSDGISGIPALNEDYLLGGGIIGFLPDLILTPGAGQNVNVTLHGTFSFTYGEAFYLIGGLSAALFDGLDTFCAFSIESCLPTPNGIGVTTLDFSNSANLVNIALPEGASALFASGTAYNITAVPEPGEWLLMLAGLGLVGWRARHRA